MKDNCHQPGIFNGRPIPLPAVLLSPFARLRVQFRPRRNNSEKGIDPRKLCGICGACAVLPSMHTAELVMNRDQLKTESEMETAAILRNTPRRCGV